jgi:hypothetical protein
MLLKKSLRVLAVGVAVAGCVLVIQTYFGTVDDACAKGHCDPTCPHTACVTTGCGDDGIMPTTACTHASFQGPHPLECSVGCRTLACN